jgi:uroporphyrinogen decarboxylase
MSSMTRRERLLKIFDGQKVDRISISPFIWTNFVNEFFKVALTNMDELLDEKLAEIYRHFDLDIMHRTCTIWESFQEQYLDSKEWKVDIRIQQVSSKKRVETTVIKTPESVLKQVREFEKTTENEEISAVTEHFIKSEDDFKQFVKYQPEVSQYDCRRITRARDIVGADGLVCPWTQGVFNCVSEHRKLDELIMDAYVSPTFYKSMMEYFMQRWMKVAVQFVDAGADVLCYGGNIANGSMVGPNFFEKNVLKYEKELIEVIQSRGAHVLYHNCGDSNSMYKIYNSVGFSGLESMTEPPYGDTDIGHAISILGKSITIIGNIDQIDFLKKASPEEIKDKVKKLLCKVKPRGNFILGTSDYFSEGTPYGNIKALVEAGYEYGSY